MRTILLTGLLLTVPAFLVVLATRPESESFATEATKKVVKIEASDIGQGTIILGDLGLPIGEEITIHGKKRDTKGQILPTSGHEFVVDTLNNRKLEPTTVGVDGIEQWPAGTEATFRGYEVGTIRFLHAEDTNIQNNDPTFKPHQFLGLRFHPIKVLEPKGMKLTPER